MVIDYDAIGMRIKIARIKARLTQETIADKTGLSVVHISNIENGNAKMSLPSIVNIANALSVSVDELLCDSVIHSNHVFNKEVQEILSDCTPYDIRILVDILKSSKEALRRDERFKLNMSQKKSND